MSNAKAGPISPEARAAQHKKLAQFFGFPDFRGVQWELLEALLEGRSALGLMPTGSGKSLVYQMLALQDPVDLVLVVSPLISLMQDQVQRAQSLGISSLFINSSLRRDERESAQKKVASGGVRLLFVTPERFHKADFRDALKGRRVDYFVVDEAHCLSLWGNDFRPDYRKLGAIRRELGSPPCLALTATATPRVQADIQSELSLDEVWKTSFARPDLSFSVHSVYGLDEKIRSIVGLVAHAGGPSIVYVSLISSLYKISDELSRLGISHVQYHGDLSPRERRQRQNAFFAGESPLCLATPAFGLGVDKPDVRLVCHAEIPRSLEDYYQEAGRAGRDGQGAEAVLLYDSDDVSIQMEFLKSSHPDTSDVLFVSNWIQNHRSQLDQQGLQTLRDQLSFRNTRDHRVDSCLRILARLGCLVEASSRWGHQWVRAPNPEEVAELTSPDLRRHALGQILKLVEYAEMSSGCRLQKLLEHFGELSRTCGSCDLCRVTK